MAGKIIADTLQTEASFLQLNVSTTRIATMNASGIYSNTGTKMIGYDGTIGVATIANTAIDGVITATQLAANSVNSSIIAANTVTNTNLQTGSIENYFVDNSFSLGMRNRIINGDMRIDQRNAGASVTPTNNQFITDRWIAFLTQASKYTAQQNQDSVTPPVGFTNYLGATSSSAYSVVSGDYFAFMQKIEGYNVSDFGWGTANAKTVTLSFWVRSSLTGTFGGAVGNVNYDRSYPFSYTISSANTWTQISVTIAGDTTGTWNTTNGEGLHIWWSLGSGSTFSGTAGSWQSGNLIQPTGSVSVVGTNGATFYITGVQLEVGSVATPFERRPYGTELSLCQRYYYKVFPGVANRFLGTGFNVSTTISNVQTQFAVPMRVAPSAVEQNGTANNYMIAHTTIVTALTAVPTFSSATDTSSLISTTVSSGLTAGQACQLRTDSTNGATAYLAWSAEL